MKKVMMAMLFLLASGSVAAAEQVISSEEAPVAYSVSGITAEKMVANATPKPLTVAFTTYVNGSQSSRLQSYFGAELSSVENAKGFAVTFNMQNTAQIATFTIEGVAPLKQGNTWTFQLKTLKDIAMGEMVVKNDSTRHTYQFDLQFHVPGKKEYVKTPYRDIAAYENEYIIGHLFRKGVFTAATKFNPNNQITRSQFSQTLTRSFLFETTSAKAPFTDIQKLSTEANRSIATLWQQGIINGNVTEYRPADAVTRREAAVMMYRLLKLQGIQTNTTGNPFKDIVAKEVELIRAAAMLNDLGVMTGSQGNFNPDKKLTRHQMAKVLHYAIRVVNNK